MHLVGQVISSIMSNINKELNEQQEIVEHFQKLREQQQDIAAEITKVDDESREHRRVIDMLKKLPDNKKCYRLIGGTLVEYEVKDVLPTLSDNVKNLEVVMTKLNEQLVAKGKEVNDYKEKHNIRFINEKEVSEMRKDGVGETATTSAAK
uniref:Prefoldin subunit 2 n=1 Tax=Ascaris lumbricoides TaxID=6252 RepID=A0A0M3IA32_ASCLU